MGDDPRTDQSLSRRYLDPDPFAQFRTWMQAAEQAGIPMPNAMCVATADAQGRPSVRHVLLRDLDDRGFVFFSNYESRKGKELAENPHAALVFLWKALDRQINVTGTVERIPREESEGYFATRPREARIGAWASRQSEVIAGRDELDARYAEFDARYPGDDVPLPSYWGGYRLSPDTIEFWQGRLHRLHDRFRYTRRPNGSWLIERLSP